MRACVCLDPLEFAPLGNWLVPKEHTNFNKVKRNWPQHQFQHLALHPPAVLTINLTFSAPEKALPHRDNQEIVSKGQKRKPQCDCRGCGLGPPAVYAMVAKHGACSEEMKRSEDRRVLQRICCLS